MYVADLYPDKTDRAVELGAYASLATRFMTRNATSLSRVPLAECINDDTVERLKAEIVCGSANNQLLEDRHAEVLADRGILYARTLWSTEGLINVSFETAPGGYSREQSLAKVSKIYDILLKVFRIAEERA